jgi:hypothetical protein
VDSVLERFACPTPLISSAPAWTCWSTTSTTLVVLSKRLPWAAIKQALAAHFEREPRSGTGVSAPDLLGEHEVEFGHGISPAGRPRLQVRLMVGLQYLKNAFNLGDEEPVQRWSRILERLRGVAVLQRPGLPRATATV